MAYSGSPSQRLARGVIRAIQIRISPITWLRKIPNTGTLGKRTRVVDAVPPVLLAAVQSDIGLFDQSHAVAVGGGHGRPADAHGDRPISPIPGRSTALRTFSAKTNAPF